MRYAQCCHGDGSGVRDVHMKYHGHSLYYQATIIVTEAICCHLFYHADGSDVVHVCTKCNGHMHYYQATILEIVINCYLLLLPWRW